MVTQQLQANIPVTPSEPEGSKGKGKRHSEGPITAKRWTPIATHRNRKPQNSASIQGKPTLTACTGKITFINPVVNIKGKFPKAADNNSVQGTVKETLFSKGTSPRTEKACPEPEDLEEDTFDIVVDGKTLREIIPTLPFTFPFRRNFKLEDCKDMDQFFSTTNSQKIISMEHGQQEVQPGTPLGRTWRKLPGDLSQRDRLHRPYGNHQRLESHQEVQTPGDEGKQNKGDSSHYPSYRRTVNPDRAYSYSFRLIRSRPNQLPSGFTPFRNQQFSDQESPFFTIPGGFQEKTRTQGQKQDLFQPKAERVRPNDPEAVGIGEISTQEPEIVVHTSRISSPINRNITPTQIEHGFDTTESKLNSDSLWLQMSKFSEKTQRQLSELQASHERMKALTVSMDKIGKNLQEGHAQLSNTSEETNKRLNIVFEEQNHRKRDRDCLDQDINKLFNFYNNMKPQPKCHVMDIPYHQGGIKPDALLENKEISQSQYQDGDNMSYSEK
ncbi:hypothetical protein O181_002043 [Austropuccinia psidii MF-1]|uniref:Uncharacterized protein n=1 Tax=Austropuccinia psidii MF-1 TaxID=1389203 RepID=A0A9Q3BBZ8_9BASI|nr:hypothetical protein [Austropuccinia psidii MF-1]